MEEDIDLSELHAFDLKSNEWPIAALQIYESLYKLDYLTAVNLGVAEPKEDAGGLSSTLRPLLTHLNSYRKKVALPADNRFYSEYPNLLYIEKRLEKVETQI